MDFFSPQVRIPWNYFLIDAESKLILARPNSINVTKALSEGILNTGLKAFAYENLKIKNPDLDINAIDDESEFYKFERGYLTQIDEGLISDELRAKKTLALHRQKYLNLLEIFCMKNVLEQSPYFLGTLSEAVRISVDASDDSRQSYHPAVGEYAKIDNIPAESAYAELKLYNDSIVHLQLRSFAIFKKFSRKINSVFKLAEMENCYTVAKQELFFRSRI